MNPSDKKHYLKLCTHPTIQALQPVSENTADPWMPTVKQLHEILNQKLPYPDRSNFSKTANGWEYETDFREWAADYGTYIDTHRQFVGPNAEIVLLQVVMALLGIDGRWMV